MSRSLALALATALPLAAQSTSIIDRANQGAPSTPSAVSPAEAPPASPGAGSDAGIQRVAEPRRLPFRASASIDQQLYATSNVFLVPDNNAATDTGALVSTTTLAAGIDTYPVVVGEGRLSFSADLVWQRNHHGLATSDPAIEALDFESYSLPLAASYRWGRGWDATASITVGSLYSIKTSAQELIYRSTVPALSLRKLTRLSEKLIASTGLGLAYADTKASLHDIPAPFAYRDDRNDRVDVSFDAAIYAIEGPWTLSPSFRLVQGHYFHWQEGGFQPYDRDDLTASFGLSVSYSFADWGSARAFATYDLRESSGGFDYDYESGAGGVGLNLSLRF